MAFGQITQNNIEVLVRNDDAGEISNWLGTGDDLGETQASLISVNLLNKDSVYNFRFKMESTEYSALHTATPEPRDILFTELNNFQIAIDNNKFKNNSGFFSSAAGLFYIQGRMMTPGATGQKYYWHKWLVNNVYSDKYWIYVGSPVKDRFIPYAELKYGINKLIFNKTLSRLNTITNFECRIAGKFDFTGIGARTYFDLTLSNERFKMHSIDIELEGYYLTNIIQYQSAYLQVGTRFNFRYFSVNFQIKKPIVKYLDNPYIKYDDMEVLFTYGLLFFLNR